MSHAYRKKMHLKFDRLTVILIAAFVVLVIISSILGFFIVRNLVSSWSMTGDLPGIQVNDQSGQTSENNPAPSGPLQAQGGPTPQPWDGASRVTLLIMGLDYRDWEAGEHPRSDTMILFTLDPITKTGGMLSIPRDLWVDIPGYGYYKINMAYFFGEANNLPGGGPGLAIETVEQFLGVPINYYAQIDFSVFEGFINRLDGIEIDVPEEITVDPLGPGNTVTLQPGKQIMHGPVALAYARARYTDGGDFDRAQRQQQVIMAIRDRILRFDKMSDLIFHAPGMYKEFSSGLRTNLTLEQVIQLALLAQKLEPEDIHRGIIGAEQVTFGKSPDNLDILVPIADKIRAVRDEVFSTGGPASPIVLKANLEELVKSENARISIQNGTQQAGLASQTSDYVKSLGLNIVDTSNANELYSATTIIDYTGKPYTMDFLVRTMNISPNRIFSRYEANSQFDIQVIAGSDWINNNPMP